MFARNDKNEIFSWGENQFGQLATGSKSDQYLKPQKIDFFNDKNIIQISCGSEHCLALSSDGLVYQWGSNRNAINLSPQPILEKIKFIDISWTTCFAVSFDGKAYYWGEVDCIKLLSVNVAKICVYSEEEYIILDNNGKALKLNNLKQTKNEIQCEDKLIDLYYQDYYCLLKSEYCVYRLEDNNGVPQLIQTNFINFYDFYSQKLNEFKKTIEKTKEENLITKEIHFNPNEMKLFLKNEIFFQRKYENLFEEIKKLGSGMFGEVFKVKQNNVFYAIKRLKIIDELDLREIQIMSKLKSDFIVQYIDSWIECEVIFKQINRFLYIQMELCSYNLKNLIELMNETFDERFQTFRYFISCKLFKELIECVNYLQSLNPPIIHRDLKPENILISNTNLKLCDFGEAKVHEKSDHTKSPGTFEYMAPEVLNSRKYNTKSDIYSLALIATEIFRFEDYVTTISNHKNRQNFNKYLTKYLNTNLEKEFRKLLETLSNCLLQKDYHSRPDCTQLLAEFNGFSIDKSFILKDKYLLDFKFVLEKHENLILKNIFSNYVN